MAEVSDVDAVWAELVTSALLGTDRRPPALPERGEVADLVADALRPDDASRLLAAVGTVAAVRRAAFVPLPAEPGLQPPDVDDRPMVPAIAVATLQTVIADWPVLEDEWVVGVVESGLRLPPDAIVQLLRRHRRDPARRARIAVAGGPTVPWLIGHVPDLAPASTATVSAETITSLPDLPVPVELAELLVADAHTFSTRLRHGFEALAFGRAHLAVLANLLARCRPEVLVDAADALADLEQGMPLALADLARLRRRMLDELTAASRAAVNPVTPSG